MRCLYCGKSLPLLKKLTGGGEFCSDAHRNKYQEEYNKLALSRLLQAQAPGSESAAGGTTQQMPRGTMRALPAPMPRPGQKALPPPGGLPAPMPRPAMRALPAPSSAPPAPPAPIAPGSARGAFPVPSASAPPSRTSAFAIPRPPEPPPAPPVAAPVAEPPRPKPQPDPPFGGFRMESPKANAPASPAQPPPLTVAVPEWSSAVAALPLSSGLVADPADWENIVEIEPQEQDPPEAPAWDHPMTVRSAPEVSKPAPADAEAFPARPIVPIRRGIEISPVRPPQRSGARLPLPADLAAPTTRHESMPAGAKWDLRVGLPDWRPKLANVVAPPAPAPAPAPVEAAPPPVPVMEEALPVEAAPVPEPVVEPVLPVAPPPPPPAPASDGGVFIDLSLLGMLEEKPAPRRR